MNETELRLRYVIDNLSRTSATVNYTIKTQATQLWNDMGSLFATIKNTVSQKFTDIMLHKNSILTSEVPVLSETVSVEKVSDTSNVPLESPTQAISNATSMTEDMPGISPQSPTSSLCPDSNTPSVSEHTPQLQTTSLPDSNAPSVSEHIMP